MFVSQLQASVWPVTLRHKIEMKGPPSAEDAAILDVTNYCSTWYGITVIYVSVPDCKRDTVPHRPQGPAVGAATKPSSSRGLMAMHKVALVTLPECRLKLDELCGHVAIQASILRVDHSSEMNSPGIKLPTLLLLPSRSRALCLVWVGQRQNTASGHLSQEVCPLRSRRCSDIPLAVLTSRGGEVQTAWVPCVGTQHFQHEV